MTTANILRKKVRVTPIVSREEATALAVTIAELELKRDEAALIRDQKIATLNEEFNLTIEAFDREISEKSKGLQAWAVTNREAEFGEKKSIRLAGHALKFREGTGAVAYTAGTDENDVIEALCAHEDESVMDRFVAIKPSLNKNAVIAAFKAAGTAWTLLSSLGLRVIKKETFTFESNRDEVDRKNTTPV